MPGRRDANLRSGHVHEKLGLTLLQAVGLVAEVPATEDVGADAFVTLLRPEGSRGLAPENSFLVQIKAASVTRVPFKGPHAVRWLTELDVPLFVASVDLAASSISLYATHRLQLIAREGRHEEIHLYLERVDERSSGPGVRYVNLGPPVITWSMAETQEEGFRERAHGVLKPHIARQQTNIGFRDIGYYEPLRWRTNHPPEADHGFAIFRSRSDTVSGVLESMAPQLKTLMAELYVSKHYRDLPTLLAMLCMMRRHGVDPDPDGTLTKVALAFADGEEIGEAEIIGLRSLAMPGKLDLSYTRITDAALCHIPPCTEMLSLRCTNITDAGLGQLVTLRALRRLNLSNTEITDRGMAELLQLDKLEWANLSGTRVSEPAVRRLKEDRPGLEVVR
jgi:hypothetical protein